MSSGDHHPNGRKADHALTIDTDPQGANQGADQGDGMTRKNKNIVMNCEQAFGPEWNWMPKNLVDLTAWVEKYLELVPEPYRDSATLEIVRLLDSPRDNFLNVKVHYARPETDEEMEKRLVDEEAQKSEAQRAEKQRLADLKAKFNDR